MTVTKMVRVPRPSRVTDYVSSRIGAPAVDPDELRAVLARYDLDQGGTARNLRLGRRSRNVVIRSPRGDVVVKRYRPQWTAEAVRYGHSILLRLEDVRFPAVRLVRTPSGETWVAEEDGVFAVFAFVPGQNYSLNYLRRRDRLELTRVAAATLAGLHRALDGYVPEGAHHLSFRSTGERVRDVAWHADKLDDVAARSERLRDDDARAVAADLLPLAPSLLAGIAALEPRLLEAPLRRLVIHGDFGLHNLIFPTPSEAVPVDFEVARLDWRVNDLISAIGKYRFRDGSYDLESMDRFLAAYATAWPLTVEERELFSDAWKLHRLRAAVQYWNSYFETDGPIRKLRSARHAIAQAAWIDEHQKDVARLVAAAAGSPR